MRTASSRPPRLVFMTDSVLPVVPLALWTTGTTSRLRAPSATTGWAGTRSIRLAPPSPARTMVATPSSRVPASAGCTYSPPGLTSPPACQTALPPAGSWRVPSSLGAARAPAYQSRAVSARPPGLRSHSVTPAPAAGAAQ
jgi:hypothetical protein